MKQWSIVGALAALVACGGGDEGGDAMAKEVGGTCAFIPGQYVLSYEVRGTSGCEGDIEPLSNEYVTILSDGTPVSTGSAGDESCVDSADVSEGCFVAFSRHCEGQVLGGYAVVDGDYEFEFDRGTGNVAVTVRGYTSTGAMMYGCSADMEATIRRR